MMIKRPHHYGVIISDPDWGIKFYGETSGLGRADEPPLSGDAFAVEYIKTAYIKFPDTVDLLSPPQDLDIGIMTV